MIGQGTVQCPINKYINPSYLDSSALSLGWAAYGLCLIAYFADSTALACCRSLQSEHCIDSFGVRVSSRGMPKTRLSLTKRRQPYVNMRYRDRYLSSDTLPQGILDFLNVTLSLF